MTEGITLDLEKCVGCGNCTTACPPGLVRIVRGKVHIVEGCNLCGLCQPACGYYAIKIDTSQSAGFRKKNNVPEIDATCR